MPHQKNAYAKLAKKQQNAQNKANEEFSAETAANFVVDIERPVVNKSAMFQPAPAATPETTDNRYWFNPTRLFY